jgi:hypothetical protein
MLVICASSPLRAVGSEEVQRTLRDDGHTGVITEFPLNTSPYAHDVAGGYWDESEGYLRDAAQAIRRTADELGHVELHYFGIADIPHIIALGAYVGDERLVHVHDYDRDGGSWAWPEAGQTVAVEVTSMPQGHVPLAGAVVVRVAISETIADAEVNAVVGSDKLADVTIRLQGRVPTRGLIRSAEDVAAVRSAFREALATLGQVREIDLVHLFVAAPPSVCFVIGQELHLRSGSTVLTYQHRSAPDAVSYQEAIRLTAAELAAAATPLSGPERALADWVRRTVFADVLRDLLSYATTKQEDAVASGQPWFWYLLPREPLRPVALFPTLPPVWSVVDPRDIVAEAPHHDPLSYARDEDEHEWRLGDRLLLALHRAVDGEEAALRSLIRLFLFHEYLHDYQVLTKYTATDVGSFANCLERIDYLADTYALVHQLDFALRNERATVTDEDAQRSYLADQIDLAIRSFWAFEPQSPHYRWQERRLRRYLNWYWRRVQVARARSLEQAFEVLSRQPSIEVAGLAYATGGGRIFVHLDRPRLGEDLEIGLVLEDDRFQRYGTAGDLSIERVLEAFAKAEQDQIKRFFNSLFDTVDATGGALPPVGR